MRRSLGGLFHGFGVDFLRHDKGLLTRRVGVWSSDPCTLHRAWFHDIAQGQTLCGASGAKPVATRNGVEGGSRFGGKGGIPVVRWFVQKPSWDGKEAGS